MVHFPWPIDSDWLGGAPLFRVCRRMNNGVTALCAGGALELLLKDTMLEEYCPWWKC